MEENKKFFHRKSLGQNFLHDKNILKKISLLGEIGSDDIVLEIGPGKGALTRFLIQNAGRVIVVEKDRRLIGYLKDEFKDNENLNVINKDILDTDFKDFNNINRKIKLISNLPYNITAPILLKIYKNRKLFERIVITIQKEVGEKLSSPHGVKTYGSLSILFQNYFDVKKNFKVPAAAFYPKPRVDSVVMTLKPLEQSKHPVEDEETFEKIIRYSFSTRRKIILNSLGNYFDKKKIEIALNKSGIDYNRRAESLSIDEFVRLSNNFL